jgi:hypothetical protein
MARHALLDPCLRCCALDRLVVNFPVEVMTPPDAAFGIDRELFRRKDPKPIKRLRRFSELPREGV